MSSSTKTIPYEDLQQSLLKNIPNNINFNRVSSVPVLSTFSGVSASDIAKPGGFRREFLSAVNEEEADITDIDDNMDNLYRFYCDVRKIRVHHTQSLYDLFIDDEEEDEDRIERQHSQVGGLSTISHGHHKDGVVKTCLSIFKAFIGVGILFLPNAFHNGGWLFSLITLLISAILSIIGIVKLSAVHHEYPISYSELGRLCYGQMGSSFISISLALSQLFFAVNGFIFTSNTLYDVICARFDYCDERLVYLIIIGLLIPLSWIRRIGAMKFTNGIGNVCILVSIIYVCFVSMTIELEQYGVADGVLAFNSTRFLSFIGTAAYAFEGIGLVIPIRETMKEPKKFTPVLIGMVLFMTFILSFFGLVNYIAYGPNVSPIVLNEPDLVYSIPPKHQPNASPFSQLNWPMEILYSIKFFYIIAIILSFPITIFPTFHILESVLFNSKSSKSSFKRIYVKNLMRTCIVFIVVIIAAVARDDVEIFVSLVGSFCCIPLAFIFPAVLHYQLIGPTWSDIFLGSFGAILMPVTIYIDLSLWGTA